MHGCILFQGCSSEEGQPECKGGAEELRRAVEGEQASDSSQGSLTTPPPTKGDAAGIAPSLLSPGHHHPPRADQAPLHHLQVALYSSPLPSHPPSLFTTTRFLRKQDSPFNNLSPNSLVVLT